MRIIQKKFILKCASLTGLMMLYFTQLAFAEDGKSKAFEKAWNALFNEFSVIVSGFLGLAVLTSMIVFIIHMIKLGSQAGSHPIIRAQVIRDIVISGVTTGLLGSIGLIYALIVYTSWVG